LHGAVVPSLPHSQGLHSVLLVLAALIGTGTGSMTNLTYSNHGLVGGGGGVRDG